MIDAKTFAILKFLYKNGGCIQYENVISKFKKHSNPSAEESIDLLDVNKLITLDYLQVDEWGNLKGPKLIKIATLGRIEVERCHDENIKHWQKIFIPQILNIIVSFITAAITTIITFFILQWLNKG